MYRADGPQVIVVGGGLCGLSAAHTILERGGRVVLLDKNAFLGGNSTRATSGINGAGTSSQRALNPTPITGQVVDSPELFYDDTARSARELVRPELVKVLTFNSGSAVEWLKTNFGLDLSLVSRLGGHSAPRTHRGKEKFPGMTITYALMEKLDILVNEHPELAEIRFKAHVKSLIKNGNEVIGVEYTDKDGQTVKLYGPVILATGGYAADFTDTSLLKKYRPDIYNLPTTNGDYSTGDGHKMTIAVGGNAIDLEKVQVHPTGLVDPKDPEAKVLFLAAEALRGVGGILLGNDGKRFCDELGHRDYVTGKMWDNKKGPYRLILNGPASREIEWHCKHYMGRGLMKHFKSGAELAKEMGLPISTLESTFSAYNDIMDGKTKCPFGKKYYSNGPWKVDDEFYVAIVTPVLHYTMGGVEINAHCEVQSPSGSIPGLFAAGELAGGVHGANRLGGSSLLGCVVFGRVSGDAAAKYLLDQISSGKGPAASAGASNLKVEIEPSGNGRIVVSWGTSSSTGSAASSSSAPAPAAAPAAAAAPAREYKEYTLADVAKHNSEKDCWVVVDGQVLDVTKFLPDHPGGKKAVLIYAGKDATEEFLMMHKLDVIPRHAAYTVIGKIKGSNPSPAGMVPPAKL